MLSIELKTEIAALAHQVGEKRVVLFGSRARNEERPRSDIDLAVFGLPQQMEGMFLDGIDEMPTLLKFDVVLIDDRTSADLLAEIRRDEVVIYESA